MHITDEQTTRANFTLFPVVLYISVLTNGYARCNFFRSEIFFRRRSCQISLVIHNVNIFAMDGVSILESGYVFLKGGSPFCFSLCINLFSLHVYSDNKGKITKSAIFLHK